MKSVLEQLAAILCTNIYIWNPKPSFLKGQPSFPMLRSVEIMLYGLGQRCSVNTLLLGALISLHAVSVGNGFMSASSVFRNTITDSAPFWLKWNLTNVLSPFSTHCVSSLLQQWSESVLAYFPDTFQAYWQWQGCYWTLNLTVHTHRKNRLYLCCKLSASRSSMKVIS